MGEAFLMNIMGRGNDGTLDRVLNAPTNEAWIDPWVLRLRSLGVRFRTDATVEGLEVRNGRIVAARVRSRGRRRLVEADWFVCAMPVERARRLWSAPVLRLDPALESMNQLFYDWMSGIQLYLRRPLDFPHGHVTFADAPWALTALTQGQFWPDRRFPRDYGDGSVVDCLSVDISDWDTPGILYGKPAKLCTREQVAAEVWAQIKAHLNDNGSEVLIAGPTATAGRRGCGAVTVWAMSRRPEHESSAFPIPPKGDPWRDNELARRRRLREDARRPPELNLAEAMAHSELMCSLAGVAREGASPE